MRWEGFLSVALQKKWLTKHFQIQIQKPQGEITEQNFRKNLEDKRSRLWQKKMKNMSGLFFPAGLIHHSQALVMHDLKQIIKDIKKQASGGKYF